MICMRYKSHCYHLTFVCVHNERWMSRNRKECFASLALPWLACSLIKQVSSVGNPHAGVSIFMAKTSFVFGWCQETEVILFLGYQYQCSYHHCRQIMHLVTFYILTSIQQSYQELSALTKPWGMTTVSKHWPGFRFWGQQFTFRSRTISGPELNESECGRETMHCKSQTRLECKKKCDSLFGVQNPISSLFPLYCPPP